MTLVRSEARVRNLSVEDLDLEVPMPPEADASSAVLEGESLTDVQEPLPGDSKFLAQASKLLRRHGGLILSGPPGTSKSFLAARLALALSGSSARTRFVQFHPSYQYEDFIQGYVPTDKGFELKAKHLVEMAEQAEAAPDLTFVLVIDELSRGDAARIFGEALTYVERTKRGLAFSLASGLEFSIPSNLLFIATMNPFDRGVDEVDAAFERRFAKVALDPSVEILEEMLETAELPEPYRTRLIRFFRVANGKAQSNPYASLGHTYFLGVSNQDDLQEIWEYQLRFLFGKAYQLDPEGLRQIENEWDRIFIDDSPTDSAPDEVEPAGRGGAREES